MNGEFFGALQVPFAILPFKAGNYWSRTSNRMYWADDIGTIVWENDDLPVKMNILNLEETVKFVQEHPGTDKKSRCALMRIVSERFALKDRVGIDKWNGIIYVDLDMIHSINFGNLDAEKQKMLYEGLDYAMQNICPNNYCYIEHSNSGTGIHLMFYFDCEKTQENYDKYTKYIYEIFRYKIDDYIKDFSSIFTATDGHNVFDPVYLRPYQKLYITTKDYIVHNCSGYCDDIIVEEDADDGEAQEKQDEEIIAGTLNVRYVTHKKKWTMDYNDRLYVLTALKRYVGDYDKVAAIWYKFCEDITLYKDYTVQKFKNMLDQNWKKIRPETGHIGILKKYGFNINEDELHLWLKDGQYVGDYMNDILSFFVPGLNMLRANPGTGKTEVWKAPWEDIGNDIMSTPLTKSVLIIEPYNSIINTKYDPEMFEIITGSKKITIDNTVPKCYVTNYNHLMRMTPEGPVMMDNIDEFFSQFEYVIIDESHIMIKDQFRSDVLIPFLKTISNVTSTKIILQTATPFFERSVLSFKKTIVVHKEDKQYKKVIFRQADKNFNIGQIICLTNYYIRNNKKVYIYWSNGSLNNMKFFNSIFPESVIIYHKRNNGDDSMEMINKKHKVGDTNVIMSTVYFGVGNDLNDEVDDAAVIIIGNNSWQEDVQAIGRWRRAKNVEVCIVLLPNEKEYAETTWNSSFDWSKRYDQIKYNYELIYDDALNRDKSIVIGGKAYAMKDRSYAHYLAAMTASNDYNRQLYIKLNEFKRRGYDVRETIKPLLTNDDWLNELNDFRKNVKDVRNQWFKKFLNNEFDWDEINKDTALERCAKIIKRLISKDLLKYCDIDKFIKSKILRYETFLLYYNKGILDELDYAELFSFNWVKEHIKAKKDDVTVSGVILTSKEYYMLCGYLIWLIYRNRKDKTDLTNFNYYTEYCSKCKDMINIEDKLINRIFAQNAYSKEYNEFVETFLGEKIDKDLQSEDIIDCIIRLDVDNDYIKQNVRQVLEYIKDKQKCGKIGGKIGGKKTDRVKDLETGIIYKSVDDCAKAINHNRSYISKHKDRFTKL